MSIFYTKNLQYNCTLNNIILKKKKIYLFKNKIFFNNAQIFYYSDNANELDTKKLLFKFYYIFKKMENISGKLAFFKAVSIKIKNKKKFRKRSFIVVACNLYNSFDFFFNFFLVNNYITKVNVLKSVKFLYKSNQEFIKKQSSNFLTLTKKKLLYKEEIFFKNFTFKKLPKRSKELKSKKRFSHKHFHKFLPMYFFFKSSFILYLYKFLSVLISNQLKLLLFLYKFYRNKFIKI